MPIEISMRMSPKAVGKLYLKSIELEKKIQKLEEELEHAKSSHRETFGDGWYDGFIIARTKQINGEILEEISLDDVMRMSEDAQSNVAKWRWCAKRVES